GYSQRITALPAARRPKPVFLSRSDWLRRMHGTETRVRDSNVLQPVVVKVPLTKPLQDTIRRGRHGTEPLFQSKEVQHVGINCIRVVRLGSSGDPHYRSAAATARDPCGLAL